jgi:hypothetical protein
MFTGSNTRRIAKELLAEGGVKFMIWDKSDANEDLLETSADVTEASCSGQPNGDSFSAKSVQPVPRRTC